MIVVDVNVMAYLFLPSEFTDQAEKLMAADPDWVAPPLWRSEFRNILANYLRKGLLTLDKALEIQREAETQMADSEREPDSAEVLRLAQNSGCSAYDCEYVALARALQIKLVSHDKKLARAFPKTALSLSEF
ncbi:MAG: type II toxin-antitoxin system VapC family toxin [Gemmataceae bacterium]